MTQPERRSDPGNPEAEQRPVSRKMAELRQRAQHDPNFLYLLPSSMEPPRTRRSRRPLLLLGVGGAILAAGALAMVALGGSGGTSATPTPPSGGQPVDQAKAAAVAPVADESPVPTATRVVPTPTPRNAEDTQREGAIPVPSGRVAPAGDAPHFVTPLTRKGKVVDRFGTPRGEGYIHGGIDVSPGTGQFDVAAACDGSVVGADHSGAYGDFVVVDCFAGWRTVYANMAQVTVKRGQLVTASASTLGQAVDILHFEIRYLDSPLDPEPYVNIAAGPIAPTPTPGPSPSPTATSTATPGASPTTDTSSPASPGATSTPQPPTATSVPTSTPTPTATPTLTPTPRPAKKSPTPAPKLN